MQTEIFVVEFPQAISNSMLDDTGNDAGAAKGSDVVKTKCCALQKMPDFFSATKSRPQKKQTMKRENTFDGCEDLLLPAMCKDVQTLNFLDPDKILVDESMPTQCELEFYDTGIISMIGTKLNTSHGGDSLSQNLSKANHGRGQLSKANHGRGQDLCDYSDIRMIDTGEVAGLGGCVPARV